MVENLEHDNGPDDDSRSRTALPTELAGLPTELERANRLHAVHLDRARRLHENHQRGPDSRSCGLCLVSWPCPARTWADRALRAAQVVP